MACRVSSGRTVIIAGAGCAAGSVLAHGFAEAGARVVVIDREETAVLPLAASAPDRIDALCLDILRPEMCRQFASIWDTEPLAALIQLQILRHGDRPAMAIRSVAEMARALQPGLAATGGQILYLCDSEAEDATTQSFRGAFERLAPVLQRQAAAGVAVTGLALPPGGLGAVGEAAFVQLVMALEDLPGAQIGGALLPVLPRSD